MNKEFYELFNIGVPSYEALTMSISDVTLTCSDNKTKSITVERIIRQEAKTRVSNIFGFSEPVLDEQLANVNFYTDKDAYSFFGVDSNQKLVNAFDHIYSINRNLSKEDMEYFIKMHRLKLVNFYNDITHNPYTKEHFKYLKENYPLIDAKRKKFNNHLESLIKYELDYTKMLLQKESDLSNMNYNDLFSEYLNTINLEKLALYIAFYHLKEVKRYAKNPQLAQKYLFYLTAFIRNVRLESNTYVNIGSYKVNYDFILKEYSHILNEYPYLNGIYLSREMFLDKDKADNEKVIERELNMDDVKIDESFIKPGEENENNPGTKKGKKNTELTKDELMVIKKILEERYYVYLKNEPIAKISCDKKFSNYVAFAYDNGVIIADRFKNLRRKSEVYHDAAYVFNSFNFEKQIEKNKSRLIKEGTQRIMHTPSFPEKVEKFSKTDTCDELREDIKKYTKKGHIK